MTLAWSHDPTVLKPTVIVSHQRNFSFLTQHMIGFWSMLINIPPLVLASDFFSLQALSVMSLSTAESVGEQSIMGHQPFQTMFCPLLWGPNFCFHLAVPQSNYSSSMAKIATKRPEKGRCLSVCLSLFFLSLKALPKSDLLLFLHYSTFACPLTLTPITAVTATVCSYDISVWYNGKGLKRFTRLLNEISW